MIVIVLTINNSVFREPAVSPNGIVNVTEGSNLTLTCFNPGNTGLPRYAWINDTDDTLLTTVISNPPLPLSLTNIQRTASGDYTCRSNYADLPGVNRDTTVTINVQCKFDFIMALYLYSFYCLQTYTSLLIQLPDCNLSALITL